MSPNRFQKGYYLNKQKNITVANEDVEKSASLGTVGGNVNWQSYYGKYYRDESKYLKWHYHTIQQS